jgi:hypothetical protein
MPIILLAEHFDDMIKERTGKACSKNGRDGKCVQGLDEEAVRKETTWKSWK